LTLLDIARIYSGNGNPNPNFTSKRTWLVYFTDPQYILRGALLFIPCRLPRSLPPAGGLGTPLVLVSDLPGNRGFKLSRGKTLSER
jgi:hypothetical protein